VGAPYAGFIPDFEALMARKKNSDRARAKVGRVVHERKTGKV
jgi:hypothetical protein